MVDGWIYGWTHELINVQINGCIEWIDTSIEGYIGG